MGNLFSLNTFHNLFWGKFSGISDKKCKNCGRHSCIVETPRRFVKLNVCIYCVNNKMETQFTFYKSDMLISVLFWDSEDFTRQLMHKFKTTVKLECSEGEDSNAFNIHTKRPINMRSMIEYVLCEYNLVAS